MVLTESSESFIVTITNTTSMLYVVAYTVTTTMSSQKDTDLNIPATVFDETIDDDSGGLVIFILDLLIF